jgi:hypothetical protein
MPTLPNYTTADDVLARVAAVFGADADTLTTDNPNWSTICTNAASSANGKVHRTLLGRRWTPDQILADPTIPELTSRIGCCHALREGGLTREEMIEKIKLYCQCEADLNDYPIVDDTAQQDPAGPPAIAAGLIEVPKAPGARFQQQ